MSHCFAMGFDNSCRFLARAANQEAMPRLWVFVVTLWDGITDIFATFAWRVVYSLDMLVVIVPAMFVSTAWCDQARLCRQTIGTGEFITPHLNHPLDLEAGIPQKSNLPTIVQDLVFSWGVVMGCNELFTWIPSLYSLGPGPLFKWFLPAVNQEILGWFIQNKYNKMPLTTHNPSHVYLWGVYIYIYLFNIYIYMERTQ